MVTISNEPEEALRARLELTYIWDKRVTNRLQHPNTTIEEAQRARIALTCLRLFELIATATLTITIHGKVLSTEADELARLLCQNVDSVASRCACSNMHYCPLTGLTRNELQQKIKRWKDTLRESWPNFQTALNSVGMSASELTELAANSLPRPTKVVFCTKLRNFIFLALKNLGVDANYKQVANHLSEKYPGVPLPKRFADFVFEFDGKTKRWTRLDIGLLASTNRAFGRLFEKEVSFVRRKMIRGL
jgi:hypothetical protein